jgi:hypothetical protein
MKQKKQTQNQKMAVYSLVPSPFNSALFFPLCLSPTCNVVVNKRRNCRAGIKLRERKKEAEACQ